MFVVSHKHIHYEKRMSILVVEANGHVANKHFTHVSDEIYNKRHYVCVSVHVYSLLDENIR